MRGLAALGVLLAGLTLAALSLHAPGGLVLDEAVRPYFVGLLAAAGVVWAFSVRLVLRRAVPVRAVWAALALALALRGVLVPVTPFLSGDVNRYVWDGRVQRARINPYLYVPADPALAALRDAEVYPNINRAATAPTIYAPAAQVVFAVAAYLAPGLAGMKAVIVGFEALAVLCLLGLLRAAGKPAAWVLIYAWNPLPLWAFAGHGHVDAMAIGLICAAMLMAVRWRQELAGVLIAAAVLTKFLPAVVLPALWRHGGWRMLAAAGVTVAGLYGVYAGAGWKVLGFLPGYAPDEGLTTGTGFWLLGGIARVLPLPGWAPWLYVGGVLVGIGLVGWQVMRRPGPIGADAGLLAAALTVAISPHYPWYFAWLGAFAVLRPEPWLLWLGAAPVLLYINPFGDQFLWPSVVYLPALALALRAPRVAPVSLLPGQAA